MFLQKAEKSEDYLVRQLKESLRDKADDLFLTKHLCHCGGGGSSGKSDQLRLILWSLLGPPSNASLINNLTSQSLC